MIRPIRHLRVLGAALLFIFSFAGAQENQVKSPPVKPASPVSGAQLFKEYCAVCHGTKGIGNGPAALAMKTPPVDLTALTSKNGGVFPTDHVNSVLRFGVQNPAHGSADMPIWVFSILRCCRKSLPDA